MIFANKMDLEHDTHGRRLEDKLSVLQSSTHLPVFPISARVGAEGGFYDAASGLEPAVTFMCNAVIELKGAAEKERQHMREADGKVLESVYQRKHRGTFSRVNASKLLFGADTSDRSFSPAASQPSLVDQQLDSASVGVSGYGEVFDSYDWLPQETKLFKKRDATLGGRNRGLTGEVGL